LTVAVGDLVTFQVIGFEPRTVSFNSSGSFETGDVIVDGQLSADPSFYTPYRIINVAQAVRKQRAQEKRANRLARRKARRARNGLDADITTVIQEQDISEGFDTGVADSRAISLEDSDFLAEDELELELEDAENEMELAEDIDVIEGDAEVVDDAEAVDVEADTEDVEADAKKNKNRRKNRQASRRSRRAKRQASTRAKTLARQYKLPYDQGFYGSGLLLPGQEFDVEFAKSNPPGTLKPYISAPQFEHGMIGLITVVGGSRK